MQLLNVGNRDLARDDFRPGPEDIDLRQQLAANRLQIVFTTEPLLRHSPAVRRGTKQKPRTRRAFAGPTEQGVRNVTLGRGEGAERVAVRRVHPIRNIIEEQREVFTAGGKHLLEARLQTRQFTRVAVADVEPRTQRVNEVNPTRLAALNQRLELRQLVGGICLSPDGAMLHVVLRRVEIGVQSPRRHAVEELDAFGLIPRLPVETFDYAGEKGCRFDVGHFVRERCRKKLRGMADREKVFCRASCHASSIPADR